MFKKLLVNSLLTLFLSVIALQVSADSPNEENKNFSHLSHLLSAFNQFEADFIQKTYDKDKVEVQSLTGIIKLQKPDHFYWKSNDPYAQLLVTNGKSIWHYDADLEQVVIQDYANQAAQAPILVVAENPIRLRESYKIEQLVTEKSATSFSLVALDETAALKQIKLIFSEEKLVGLNFTDSLQQKTEITFTDILLNKAINPALFEFEIPLGVDVLHE